MRATGLRAISRSDATLAIRLNSGALVEAKWTLDAGNKRVLHAHREAGVEIGTASTLCAAELRQWPTTWAKRLAFGRDACGWLIEGRLIDQGGRNATASERGPRVSTALSECDCLDADRPVAGAAGDLIR